ncbi:MAG: SWIM zinc finger family protein [bacterium]|nr:SWIM zinc finger family protein [bacterium]
MLTLENFEQTLDKSILQKGRQYFKGGQVTSLDEDGSVWTATVIGSDTYEVVIDATRPKDVETECDCPYDWGPTCKHVAAVLYAIQAQRKGTKGDKQPPKTSPAQSAKDLLPKLTREQLVEIVEGQLKKDKELAAQLVLKYSTEAPDAHIYASLIKSAIKKESDRGYLGYMGARRAAAQIDHLLDDAEGMIEQGQMTKALPIVMAVIDTLPQATAGAHDSDGELSGCMERALWLLHDHAPALPPEHKTVLFATLIEQLETEAEDFHTDLDLTDVAAVLVETPEQRDRLFKVLDPIIQYTGGFNDFKAEGALRLKIEVLERLGEPPEVIDVILDQHVHLDGIRKERIKRAMEAGNFARASELALDGLRKVQNTIYAGLVNDYRKLLAEIAERTGDNSALRTLAEELFLETLDFAQYDRLKKLVSPGEWRTYVDGLIGKIRKHPNPYLIDSTIAELYYRNGRWNDLLKLAQPRNVRLVKKYEQDFFEQFPDEIAALYERTIYEEMDRATSRDQYREWALLINDLRRYGEDERAEQIRETLLKRYPKRRAMAEELKRA